ncbi:MAG TPA: FkbM family methyltransferase [Candidatus Paceibacterota bacterium]|nr:FkbM family methyltransferase [Candidatus Paceibacterota bacterium]
MSKFQSISAVANKTTVQNHNKLLFLTFFFLTKVFSFCLRKIPTLGRQLRRIRSWLPAPEFIIQNSIGTWSVRPFNDSMTISAEYFESHLASWPGKPAYKRVCIDIGANIGKYTLMAASQYGYKKILSIEANPVTFQILFKNIALNSLVQKVTAINIAAGETEGTVTIQADSHHLGGGNIVDYHVNDAVMDTRHVVPVFRIDTLLSKQNVPTTEVDFIKIDVEGAEGEVLKGMTSTLKDMPIGSYIMIEMSRNEEAVSRVFTSNGFIKVESHSHDTLFVKQ